MQNGFVSSLLPSFALPSLPRAHCLRPFGFSPLAALMVVLTWTRRILQAFGGSTLAHLSPEEQRFVSALSEHSGGRLRRFISASPRNRLILHRSDAPSSSSSAPLSSRKVVGNLILNINCPMRFLYGPLDSLMIRTIPDENQALVRWWMWERQFSLDAGEAVAELIEEIRSERKCIGVAGKLDDKMFQPLLQSQRGSLGRDPVLAADLLENNPRHALELVLHAARPHICSQLLRPRECPVVEETERCLVRSWRGTYDVQYDLLDRLSFYQGLQFAPEHGSSRD